GNPERNGQTTDEEINESGASFGDNESHLSNSTTAKANPNDLSLCKLVGGAQYERLISDFEMHVYNTRLPSPSPNEIASLFRLGRTPNLEAMSTDIVRTKSRKILHPLAGVVLQRCTYILKRTFFIALETVNRIDIAEYLAHKSRAPLV